MNAKKMLLGVVTSIAIVGVTTVCYNHYVTVGQEYGGSAEYNTIEQVDTNESNNSNESVPEDGTSGVMEDMDYASKEETPPIDLVNKNAISIEELYKNKVSDVSKDNPNLLAILRVVSDNYMTLDRERKFKSNGNITYGELIEIANKLGKYIIGNGNKLLEYNDNLIELGITLPNNAIRHNYMEFNSNLVDKINLRHSKKSSSKSDVAYYEALPGVKIWMTDSQAEEYTIRPDISPLKFYLTEGKDFISNTNMFNCLMNRGMVLQILQYLDLDRLGMIKDGDLVDIENSKLIKDYIFKNKNKLQTEYSDSDKYLYDKLAFLNYPSYEYCKNRGIVAEMEIDKLGELITREELAVLIDNYLNIELKDDIAKQWVSGQFTVNITRKAIEEAVKKEATDVVEETTTEESVASDDSTGETTTDVNIDNGGN